jgi:hypothetical protein
MLLALGLNAQKTDWKSGRNWRLYSIRESEAFNYTLDTLKNFQSIPLDQDTMTGFLTEVEQWPKEKYSLWSGLYVVTCELPNADVRKIEISVYGGFFYDDRSKTYYQLPREIRTAWLEYLSDKISFFSL